MAAPASDWLRHFRLLLWNRWTEFNKTWQEARSQRPLTSLCFLGRSEKQDGRPGLWLAETFSTSPLKPLNRIQRNLTGSKISTPSVKFVFFGPIGKTRWPPWPLIGWDIFWLFLWNRWTEFKETWQEARSQCPLSSLCFSGQSEKQNGRPGLWLAETYFDFSSETAERNSVKLDRKEDLNVLYQVCVFRAEKWIKIATLANPSKKVAHCTQVHVMGPFGSLVCCFPKVNFFMRSLFSGERQWPLGPLVFFCQSIVGLESLIWLICHIFYSGTHLCLWLKWSAYMYLPLFIF